MAWGAAGLLPLALADSAGIPLPGGVDAMLIAVAAMRPGAAYFSATLATAGSLAGCMILFYIARKGGERYLERHIQSGKGLKFRRWFQRYGLVTVFVPALSPVPLPTKVFVILAGALDIHWRPFAAVVLAARIPRYFGLAYLGMRLGADSGAWVRAHAWQIAGLALALFLVVLAALRLLERGQGPAGAR